MSQEEAGRIARAAHRARRSRGFAKIALPTAAALGAGAAVAIGSIPQSGGTVTACYGTNVVAGASGPANFGAFRLIDPSLTISGGNVPASDTACTTGEGTLDFNEQGPQGAAGNPGANGLNGSNGAAGAPGASLIGGTTFGIANPAGSVFAKLEGLSGPVTEKGHKDDIEISSFQFGVATPSTANIGSGGLTGRRVHQTFSITKEVDSASPKLFAAETTGTVFKKCDIFFARKAGGGKVQDFLEIEMTDVVATGFSQGGAADRRTESVSFTFTKATENFVSATDKVISPALALSQSG